MAALRMSTPDRRHGEFLVRPLANGDLAVLILNREDRTMQTGFDWSDLPGMSGQKNVQFRVRDLQQRTQKSVCDDVNFVLQPHQTAFVRLTRLGECKTTGGDAR